MSTPEQLLRRLAAGDERGLGDVLWSDRHEQTALDHRTRTLAQLSALVALGAGTASVRWAVELASAAGVEDTALVRVLITDAPVVGNARTVGGAARLALALGVDLELEGWDGR